jgi:hypothetical protein
MTTKNKKMDWQKSVSDLEAKLDNYFGKKAPQLPEKAKEVIVKYGPYLTLVALVLSLPMILAGLGLGAVIAPFMLASGAQSSFHFSIGIIFSLITLVLTIMALPGLFKRQMSAWKLMFYSSLVTVVENILSFSLGNLIIGTAISWYFLFQIRSYYK